MTEAYKEIPRQLEAEAVLIIVGTETRKFTSTVEKCTETAHQHDSCLAANHLGNVCDTFPGSYGAILLPPPPRITFLVLLNLR